MNYLCKVPVTTNMGTYTTNCAESYQETREENALWQYNNARAHDGLPPLKKLPKGTTFTPIN